MNKTTFILGVDVSKLTLDVHCPERNAHVQLSNNTEGFRLLHRWCRLHLIDLTDTMVALEHTGGYEYKLLQHLQAKAIRFVRIPGLAIKRSLGIVRGKNDRIDAARIARYGRINQEHLQAGCLNEAILQLKELLGFRKRLVRDYAADQTTLGERLHTHRHKSSDLISRSLRQRIKATRSLIEKVKLAITALIEGCAELKQNYRLLTSIRGIGPVNAWMTLAYTENFTTFTNPRRYAVYVGVVPFEHSSGTSLGGKKRVSHLANKELKAELEGAAKAAIQWDPEMKKYAEGKKNQGKHTWVIRNNVKFKLILRMFAVVKRGTGYVDNLQPSKP